MFEAEKKNTKRKIICERDEQDESRFFIFS